MKCAILLAIILPMLIPTAAYCLNIDVSINKDFKVDLLYFYYNDSAGLKQFSTEMLNSGSLPYKVQARVDVFDGNTSVFTGWSDKKTVMPGNNAFFAIYWLPEKAGNYTARLRIYYGKEIIEKYIEINADKTAQEDVFNLESARITPNFISMSISSSQATGKTIIIPTDYPAGWSMTQALISTTRTGSALLSYEPSVWFGYNATFLIVSLDGSYASQKQVELSRPHGLEAVIERFAFSLINPDK